MRVVVALGGNALLRRGEPLDFSTQRRNVRRAAYVIATLAREHSVIVTHGNGPQVGLLAMQAEAYEEVEAYPLDVLGAESEGMIGYMLEQELRRVLPKQEVAVLLTQVQVDARDPAFETATKPIGPVYSAARAKELAATRDWCMSEVGLGGFRRVVASPEPRRILEINPIRLLMNEAVLVICAGGGGIPVARGTDGRLRGVEGVIDKDLSSALLATELEADALLLLTDQPGVFADWPNSKERPIAKATLAELDRLSFEPGSMAPKVEAACRFARATGKRAVIGALGDAALMLRGDAGTVISRA